MCGAICDTCHGDPDTCHDMPSPAEPIVDASIDLLLTECPLRYVTSDVWHVIELVEMMEKGALPIAGGVLDQAQGFITAARIILQEKAYWKRKLKVIG